MCGPDRSSRSLPRVAAWLGWITLSSGCVSGSLASSTGPRVSGARWSVAPNQMVHAGETVRFDFLLTEPTTGRQVDPTGLADFCVITVRKDRIEVGADALGHFPFEYTFNNVQSGQEIRVLAQAFLERGHRDFMIVGGRWVQSDSPTDLPDRMVASDSIRLTVYELTIELHVSSPLSPLDPESGVMRILRTDGSPLVRYINRPHRPGFILDGPEADGDYRVEYRANGDDINSDGTTVVEFEIYDLAGKRYTTARTFDTP